MERIFKRLDKPQKMKHTRLGQNLNKTRLVSNRDVPTDDNEARHTIAMTSLANLSSRRLSLTLSNE